MIESITEWLTVHADHAPFLIFGLLLLTGFSLPISEDVLVIVSGVLASTVLPEKTIPLFLAAFLGSYISDWIAYWIGRGVGYKLSMRFFSQGPLSPGRRAAVERFFKRFGFLTLFIGRFIPFGIRNSVFMAAGAGKMHFGRFLLSDGVGCLSFSSLIFFLAFRCGQNYDRLHRFLSSVGYVVSIVAVLSIVAWIVWSRFVREDATDSQPS
jgi:membrane-associated protein